MTKRQAPGVVPSERPPSMRALKGSEKMRTQTFRNLLVLSAALLVASAASASPITYFLSPPGYTGQVTLTATVGGNPVAGPYVVQLSAGQVTVDQTALTIDGATLSTLVSGSIPISPSVLGFTSINIDYLTVTASAGTLSLFDPGPPQGYDYTTGTVTVSGQFDAVNTNPFLSISNSAFSQPATPVMGQLYVDTGAELALNGITLLSIGGPSGVIVKGDFLFHGVVPEPGTALLVGLGLAGVGSLRRRLG